MRLGTAATRSYFVAASIKTKSMANRKLAGMLLLLAVSILSCKKDNDSSPTPADKKLVVSLQNHLIAVSDIDSANVVLRKNGTNTPYFLRLQKGTGKLEALVDGLPAGQYTADLDLYTREMPSSKHYQFVATKEVSLTNGQADIIIEGPSDLGPDGWSARKVSFTSNRDIIVLIPLDVNDPYFEVRIIGAAYNFVGVERTATLGAAVVAHKEWSCTGNCPDIDGILFIKTIFLPFTNIIQNSNWTKNELIITVGNTQNQAYNEFGLVWNK
jgi:hypothetical protein